MTQQRQVSTSDDDEDAIIGRFDESRNVDEDLHVPFVLAQDDIGTDIGLTLTNECHICIHAMSRVSPLPVVHLEKLLSHAHLPHAPSLLSSVVGSALLIVQVSETGNKVGLTMPKRKLDRLIPPDGPLEIVPFDTVDAVMFHQRSHAKPKLMTLVRSKRERSFTISTVVVIDVFALRRHHLDPNVRWSEVPEVFEHRCDLPLTFRRKHVVDIGGTVIESWIAPVPGSQEHDWW